MKTLAVAMRLEKIALNWPRIKRLFSSANPAAPAGVKVQCLCCVIAFEGDLIIYEGHHAMDLVSKGENYEIKNPF
jgi:hypothetical protein